MTNMFLLTLHEYSRPNHIQMTNMFVIQCASSDPGWNPAQAICCSLNIQHCKLKLSNHKIARITYHVNFQNPLHFTILRAREILVKLWILKRLWQEFCKFQRAGESLYTEMQKSEIEFSFLLQIFRSSDLQISESLCGVYKVPWSSVVCRTPIRGFTRV